MTAKERLSSKEFRLRVIEGLVVKTYVSSRKKDNSAPVEIKKRKPFVSAEIRTKGSDHQSARLEGRRLCSRGSTKQKEVQTSWKRSV